MTDKYTFSEADRNHIKYYLQPYISGSMGVELFLNFDSLKVNLEIIKKNVKSILVINTMNDKFGNSRKLAKAFNSLYVEMEGSHFSYFVGTQVRIITNLIYNLYFKENAPVHNDV